MSASTLDLRKATPADVQLTYNWYVNKAIRKYSGDPGLNNLEQHSTWFLKRIQSPDCLYLIALHEKEEVGSIRFDLQESRAKISYLIDPAFQGRGFGKEIIRLGIKLLMEQTAGSKFSVYGQVMPENNASLAIFRKLGFREKMLDNLIEFEIEIL